MYLKNYYEVPFQNDVLQNIKVYGLADAVRRAKYPMSADVQALNSDLTPGIQKLACAEPGGGHDHWLCGVNVQFDLTFTVKAWTEAERYNWFDIVSSQSTMHRITRFDLDKAYIGYVDPRIVAVMKEKVDAYNRLVEDFNSGLLPDPAEAKRRQNDLYLQILYSNPTGFRLTAGMTTNYLQLKTIYRQRAGHRLPEWAALRDGIRALPHSELITAEAL